VKKDRFLIVGASLAGASAAAALREGGFDGEVDLIGAETDADVFGPLRALADHDGAVVLMGVGLTRMTLLHLAEVEAGV
jgi:NADPH-dependent 2,4-dienoyl-CoA reductase/sulfur reductase-like enzyme